MKKQLLLFSCIMSLMLSSFIGPSVDGTKKVRIDEVKYKPKTNTSEAMWVFNTKMGTIFSNHKHYNVGDSIVINLSK